MSAAKFGTIRAGLKCVFWGVLSYVVSVVVSLFVDGDPTVAVVVRSTQILASVLVLSGQILCLSVPRDMPGSLLIVGALVCEAATIAGTASLFFWDPIAALGNLKAFIAMLMLIVAMFFLGDILFNVFLQRLAEYVGDKQSASRASGVLILKIIILLMCVFSFVVLFAGGVLIAIICQFIALLLCILVLFQYLTLLSALQLSVARAGRPSFAHRDVVDEEQEIDDMFKGFEG